MGLKKRFDYQEGVEEKDHFMLWRSRIAAVFLLVALGIVFMTFLVRWLGDVNLAQTMIISALVVETIIIGLALALIINIYRHYPSGDIDHLKSLRG